MHRLNLTIDEKLYEQARAVSFIEKKSISQIVRGKRGQGKRGQSPFPKKQNRLLESFML